MGWRRWAYGKEDRRLGDIFEAWVVGLVIDRSCADRFGHRTVAVGGRREPADATGDAKLR
jgi:hypothetical protein